MTGPNFELPPGWDEMARQLARQLEPMRAQMSGWAAATEQMRSQLEAHQKRMLQWAPALEEIGRRVAESWAEAMPPNWEGYETEQVSAAIERVDHTGYCLVWLPRAEVLQEVMTAAESDTTAILIRHGSEVLDDADALLAEVDESERVPECGAAGAAIHALREGHVWSAQALASSVFTSIVHRSFEKASIRQRVAWRRLIPKRPPSESSGCERSTSRVLERCRSTIPGQISRC